MKPNHQIREREVDVPDPDYRVKSVHNPDGNPLTFSKHAVTEFYVTAVYLTAITASSSALLSLRRFHFSLLSSALIYRCDTARNQGKALSVSKCCIAPPVDLTGFN
jgi:hypothetical protein